MDINEIDTISRERRMGTKYKVSAVQTLFVILAISFAIAVIIDSITHNGF